MENMSEIVGGDADARVGDVDEDFVAVTTDVDPNVATFRGIFDGVADEIVHDFAEKADVERGVDDLLELVTVAVIGAKGVSEVFRGDVFAVIVGQALNGGDDFDGDGVGLKATVIELGDVK